MPLKTEAPEEPTLNLTPMIDCVFLLIIFFMVGSRFTEQERQYEVNLPSVSEAPRPRTAAPDEITINVRADGEAVVKGKVRPLSDLAADLDAAIKNYPDQAVVIRGDASVPYQHVMTVMAVCQKAGVKSVSLANRLKSGEEP